MCTNAGYAMSSSRTISFANSSDANNYFRDSVNDWSITPLETGSVKKYTGPYYEHINNDILRAGVTPPPNSVDGVNVSRIDSALGKFDLKDDIQVYRGSSAALLGGLTDPGDINRLLKGKTVRDKGYVSTSAVKGNQFSGTIEYHIKVRAGKGKGAYISHISNYGDAESEFLLKRGTEFKVLGARQHPDYSHKTIVELEC